MDRYLQTKRYCPYESNFFVSKRGKKWRAEGPEEKMWKHSRKQELFPLKPHERARADGCWKPQRQTRSCERLISQWHFHCAAIVLFVMHAYLAAHKWWCTSDCNGTCCQDSLHSLYVIYMWEQLESAESGSSVPNIRLIYDLIRTNGKG